MRASGVICELNPFHNGHAYLLSRMRESVGDDGCVVCLMSGRFVQRGTAAMADPYLRADMALAGGADLVIELSVVGRKCRTFFGGRGADLVPIGG